MPIMGRVRELDSDVFVLRTEPFSTYLDVPMARPRFVSLLANIFGATTLLLSVIGLYGVVAAFVRHSTREIGVRIALGASATRVRGLVFTELARVLGIGVLLGMAAAWAGGGIVRSMLFEVQPHDPLTLLAAVIVMSSAGVAACSVPVRRATRVDPLTLLRDG
jgi:ABC-type antimicrobial peptide transport system permease subunit